MRKPRQQVKDWKRKVTLVPMGSHKGWPQENRSKALQLHLMTTPSCPASVLSWSSR